MRLTLIILTYFLRVNLFHSYPAMNPKVVSTAAVGKNNDLPTASFSNTNAEVDYAGIGVNVISFKAGSKDYRSMNGNY